MECVSIDQSINQCVCVEARTSQTPLFSPGVLLECAVDALGHALHLAQARGRAQAPLRAQVEAQGLGDAQVQLLLLVSWGE